MSLIPSDIDIIRGVLSCDETTAQHYLDLFDGDPERVINAAVSHGDDDGWWAHPWNSHLTKPAKKEDETDQSSVDGKGEHFDLGQSEPTVGLVESKELSTKQVSQNLGY